MSATRSTPSGGRPVDSLFLLISANNTALMSARLGKGVADGVGGGSICVSTVGVLGGRVEVTGGAPGCGVEGA
jgi:hypothetical protein